MNLAKRYFPAHFSRAFSALLSGFNTETSSKFPYFKRWLLSKDELGV